MMSKSAQPRCERSSSLSHDELVQQLEELGIRSGDAVLVRAALSQVGPLEGRSRGFVSALLKAVGPSGTIFGLSFTPMGNRFRRSSAPVFRTDSPTNSGGLTSAMLAWDGAVRSQHPTESWVGIGPLAQTALQSHGPHSPPFEPIDALASVNGKMAVIGCVWTSPGFSTVHRAQEELGLDRRSIERLWTGCWVDRGEQERTWFQRTRDPGCSRGFSKLYPAYRAAGVLKEGRVGAAESICADVPGALAVDRAILRRNPRAVLCDEPLCPSCRAYKTYNLRDLPGFISRAATSRRVWGRLLSR